MTETKPGWQTSEGWVTGLTTLAAILTSTGMIHPADPNSSQGQLANALTQIVGLLVTLAVQWVYTHYRTQAKMPEMNAGTKVELIAPKETASNEVPHLIVPGAADRGAGTGRTSQADLTATHL